MHDRNCTALASHWPGGYPNLCPMDTLTQCSTDRGKAMGHKGREPPPSTGSIPEPLEAHRMGCKRPEPRQWSCLFLNHSSVGVHVDPHPPAHPAPILILKMIIIPLSRHPLRNVSAYRVKKRSSPIPYISPLYQTSHHGYLESMSAHSFYHLFNPHQTGLHHFHLSLGRNHSKVYTLPSRDPSLHGVKRHFHSLDQRQRGNRPMIPALPALHPLTRLPTPPTSKSKVMDLYHRL